MLFPVDQIWAIEQSRFEAMLSQVPPQVVSAIKAKWDGKLALPMSVADGVAEITIDGVMTKTPTLLQALFGGCSYTQIVEAINTAAADESVRCIVMLIDSPGGAADGLASVSDALKAAASKKQIVAQVRGMAASAAYYIAAHADAIYAERMDTVGSLGTRMMMYDLSKMFDNAGIKPVVIDTGDYKSAGALGTAITDKQVAHFRSIVNWYNDEFMAAVKSGREMSDDDLNDVFDGRLFTPEEAMKLGLIDGIQTYEKTLSLTKSGVPTGGVVSIKQEAPMPTETVAAPETPKAATLAELEALSGADPQFVLESMKAGKTLAQAQNELTAKVVRENELLQAQLKAKPAAAPGVPSTPAATAPQADWLQSVREYVDEQAIKRPGVSREQLFKEFVHKDPEWHAAWVNAQPKKQI